MKLPIKTTGQRRHRQVHTQDLEHSGHHTAVLAAHNAKEEFPQASSTLGDHRHEIGHALFLSGLWTLEERQFV
jgi:hypothetical protein